MQSKLRANQNLVNSAQLNANNEISCENTFEREQEKYESLLLKLVPKHFFKIRFNLWISQASWL